MALKSRAEVQLRHALAQHQTKSASLYLREQQQKAALGAEDQDAESDLDDEEQQQPVTTTKQGTRKRRSQHAEGDTAEEAITLVRQLHDDFFVVGKDEGSSSIDRNQIEANAVARRERHMAAQRVYTEHVRRVAEDIEAALISSADRVKDALAGLDAQLRDAFRSLEDDALLLRSSNEDVFRLWDGEVLALCQQRTRVVEDFAHELDDIERSRTRRVRDGLTTLTTELMETAHALPPEVERVIEREAHELNAVVLSNRKVYADLVARIATADVDVFVDARLTWERGQRYWRRLRHDDAIRTFQTRLSSLEFTDPEQRRALLQAIRGHQEAVHNDQRLAVLQQLEDARAALTSEHATQLLQRISATQADEETQNHGFFAQLRSAHDEKHDDAERLREALRLEIHGFGAMAQEGEVELCRGRLAQLLGDSALDEFFRMAGGLRGELDAVVKRLEVSELIYEANLAPLTASVAVLLSALPLESVMETQGKGAERKALQATLEKLRKASKSEILPLLPALQTQLGVLSKLSDMGDAFKQELEDIAVLLEQLIQEYGLASTASSDTHASGAAPGSPPKSSESPSRSSTAAPAATGAAPPDATTASSLSSTSPPKSRATSEFSQAAAYSFIDLQAIRKVQRRLGTLLYASELPAPIREHLAFVSEQLALQAHANAVVDAVIAAECDALLVSREQESKLFLEVMGREMERQSARLHDHTEKLAKFCLLAALCVEQSIEKVRYIDLSALDLLDALKDDDDEQLAALEAQYLQSCARLRHAPDDTVLQDEFQAASALLRQIEDEYRLYHRKVGVAADHHAIAIEKQRQMFCSRMCSSFGLKVPVSDAHPEALDVDRFLSVTYIGNIVNPTPASQLEGDDEDAAAENAVENPQEGAGGGQLASARGSASVAAADASQATPRAEADKSRPGSRQAASDPVAEAKAVVFRAISGLETEVELEIPALVARILSHESSEEEEEEEAEQIDASSPGHEASAGAPHAAATALGDQPASSTPRDPLSASGEEEKAAEALAQAAQQQQQAMAKVAKEFLRLEIPAAVVERMLSTLRDAFVSRIDSDSTRTAEVTAETREQRFAAANLLLEERLRLHWPRSGRLGVQIHQPRMGELLNHRQRQERQIRAMLKKVEAQESAFASRTTRALEHAEQVRVKQVACQAQLPMQASLAALQGQEGRSKKLLNAFKVEGAEHVDALRAMTKADVSALAASVQEFLRACAAQQFPDVSSCDVISGCDYHPDEISALRAKIATVEAQLCAKLLEREQRVSEVEAAQAHVLALAQAFKTRYQSCMQTLSMKDGLGQKFGLPRRTAQERYRSEVTRCDERSARIDELLASLHAVVENTAVAVSRRDADVASAIVRHLLQLRAKVYTRGRYFGLLKNVSQLELTPVTFDPSGGSSSSGSVGDGGAAAPRVVVRDRDVVEEQDMRAAAHGAGSFLDFVKEVSAQCRENTRLIYQQEGKLDELPNGSVPPSLDEYLVGLADKARAYVLRQELAFREQVHFLEELLVLAPERALADLLARSQAELSGTNEQLTQALETEFAALMAQKEAHTAELRPELCSPNNVAALDALSEREMERSRRSVARLQRFRAQVMRVQLQASSAFESELVALFQCLMAILDSCVMTLDDLQPISGEPLPKLKRKTLKRLRKVARIQELGDEREAKRPDAELQRLAQLGEAPRFPRRAWPAIPSFSAHERWAVQQERLLRHDEEHALPRDEQLSTLDCASFAAAADGGACVGLLTPAHRSLVRARDAVYTTFASFCGVQNETLVAGVQERLRDEVRAAQSWERGIAAMRV